MTEANPETQPDESGQLGEGGKKALDTERAARKAAEKSLADLQAQLDQLNQSHAADLSKAQSEAQQAQESIATATVTAFREAAVEFGGIAAEDADLFLTATDKETLRKQVQRLASKSATGDAPTPGPRPDLTQAGGQGVPPALNSDDLTASLKAAVGIN